MNAKSTLARSVSPSWPGMVDAAIRRARSPAASGISRNKAIEMLHSEAGYAGHGSVNVSMFNTTELLYG